MYKRQVLSLPFLDLFHDAADKLTNMQCLPDSLAGREYYRPTEQGLEAKYKARLEQIKEWKRQHRAK